MKGLRIAIVDDEPLARRRLSELLADCAAQAPHEIVAEASDGAHALEALETGGCDVALLDIHMPGMDGLELARHLARLPEPPAVIFVTAYEEHALSAFEVHAIDYLLKPVRRDRLLEALRRARRLAPGEPRLDAAAAALGATRSHLTVRDRGRVLLVPVHEILYLRAEQKYVTIRTAARELLTEESLTALESEFGARFVRVHRNALVARAAIAGFERVRGVPRGAEGDEAAEAAEAHWEVILRGVDERLPISRRQWPSVRDAAG